MSLALGSSVRKVEDTSDALWSRGVSLSAASELNKKTYGTIEDWKTEVRKILDTTRLGISPIATGNIPGYSLSYLYRLQQVAENV